MSGPLFTAPSHDGAKVMRNQPWTRQQERELADLYAHGYGPKQISRMIGRSVGAINGKLEHMFVARKHTYRAWTMPELRRARAMREDGQSYAAIARELGRSATSVRHAILGGAA